MKKFNGLDLVHFVFLIVISTLVGYGLINSFLKGLKAEAARPKVFSVNIFGTTKMAEYWEVCSDEKVWTELTFFATGEGIRTQERAVEVAHAIRMSRFRVDITFPDTDTTRDNSSSYYFDTLADVYVFMKMFTWEWYTNPKQEGD